MYKSLLVAFGIMTIIGSIAPNAPAKTNRIELLLAPQPQLNLHAQVIMNNNNNKPGDGSNNPAPPNPPPANNPPHDSGLELPPFPIDRPEFPPGSPAGLPPENFSNLNNSAYYNDLHNPTINFNSSTEFSSGFPAGNFSNFNNSAYYNDLHNPTINFNSSKRGKVCGKGYRVIQGSLCQRVKK
jgi:hypothetical protein